VEPNPPFAAWGMMAAIAICSNLLVGYGARRVETERILILVLPLVVSISFFLIADMDSPHGGVIRVQPQKFIEPPPDANSTSALNLE